MGRKAILILWVLGILFPMGWFASLDVQSRRLFAEVFHQQWTHVVMHSFLYAVLACLLAYQLGQRDGVASPRRVAFNTLVMVMGVAILQEAIQLAHQGRLPGGDELFDLGVDLMGAGIGLVIFLGVFAKRFFPRRDRSDVEF